MTIKQWILGYHIFRQTHSHVSRFFSGYIQIPWKGFRSKPPNQKRRNKTMGGGTTTRTKANNKSFSQDEGYRNLFLICKATSFHSKSCSEESWSLPSSTYSTPSCHIIDNPSILNQHSRPTPNKSRTEFCPTINVRKASRKKSQEFIFTQPPNPHAPVLAFRGHMTFVSKRLASTYREGVE